MKEEIRDIDHHLICCADAESGLIRRTSSKEEINIRLPVGGEVLFIIRGCYTVIRRINAGKLYVFSDHHSGTGFAI